MGSHNYWVKKPWTHDASFNWTGPLACSTRTSTILQGLRQKPFKAPATGAFSLEMLGNKPRTLCMPSRCSATDPQSLSWKMLFFLQRSNFHDRLHCSREWSMAKGETTNNMIFTTTRYICRLKPEGEQGWAALRTPRDSFREIPRN